MARTPRTAELTQSTGSSGFHYPSDEGYLSQDCHSHSHSNSSHSNVSHNSSLPRPFPATQNQASLEVTSAQAVGQACAPSPSDSGVGEVETLLREKDFLIQQLRETMEKNETAILQVKTLKHSTTYY